MALLRTHDHGPLFVGKTIERVDFTCCNHLEFYFTDGSSVAIEIEVDSLGLPTPLASTDFTPVA